MIGSRQAFPNERSHGSCGKGKSVVGSSSERTVELRVAEVGTDTSFRKTAERHPIYLVERRFGVAGAVAASQIRIARFFWPLPRVRLH